MRGSCNRALLDSGPLFPRRTYASARIGSLAAEGSPPDLAAAAAFFDAFEDDIAPSL
jgi:hypothetical protein